MSQIASLKIKAKTLKGSAKEVVERRIAELEEEQRLKGTPRSVKKVSLATVLDNADNSLTELDAAVANLESRLAVILPVLILQESPKKDDSLPAALANAAYLDARLKFLTSRLTVMMEEIVL